MPDNKTNNNIDQNEVLANTDIFVLLDAKDIDDATREDFIGRMEMILVNDFFTHDVPNLLSEQEIKELENDVDAGMEQSELLQKLQAKIPNMEKIMYDKSLEFKKTFVIEQLKKNLDVSEERLNLAQSGQLPTDRLADGDLNAEIERLKKNNAKLALVIEHFSRGQWAEGVTVLSV